MALCRVKPDGTLAVIGSEDVLGRCHDIRDDVHQAAVGPVAVADQPLAIVGRQAIRLVQRLQVVIDQQIDFREGLRAQHLEIAFFRIAHDDRDIATGEDGA